MCPQMRHSRGWIHVSPVFRQSSQPSTLGVTSRIWSRCVQGTVAIISLLWLLQRYTGVVVSRDDSNPTGTPLRVAYQACSTWYTWRRVGCTASWRKMAPYPWGAGSSFLRLAHTIRDGDETAFWGGRRERW